MTLTFDVNFWVLLFGLASMGTGLWGILSANSKATHEEIKQSAQKLERDLSEQIQANKQDITYLKDALERHKESNGNILSSYGAKLEGQEADRRNAIRHSDLGEIHEKIRSVEAKIADIRADLSKNIGELSGNMARISSALDRLHDFLMQENKHGKS